MPGWRAGGEPDYCSDVSELERSVRYLGDVDVVAGARTPCANALRGVEAQAEATIDAARDDFPEETSAMRDALDSLRQSARDRSDSPTPDEIAPAAADVRTMVTSVEAFAGAAQSECG